MGIDFYLSSNFLIFISLFVIDSTLSIVESYFAVANTIETLEAVKINIASYHQKWYSIAVELAERIEVKPKVPRIAVYMKHRSNTPGSDSEEYFRRNLTIPCLDQVKILNLLILHILRFIESC